MLLCILGEPGDVLRVHLKKIKKPEPIGRTQNYAAMVRVLKEQGTKMGTIDRKRPTSWNHSLS